MDMEGTPKDKGTNFKRQVLLNIQWLISQCMVRTLDIYIGKFQTKTLCVDKGTLFVPDRIIEIQKISLPLCSQRQDSIILTPNHS